MKFDDSDIVESICYQMRMADQNRSSNRALINNLFNGVPPLTPEEEKENEENINVNFLSATRLGHNARTQFYQSILKPGFYFKATTDYGPTHKRSEFSSTVTNKVNKIMKNSMVYTEVQRSKIAMNVLHGISPATWRDDQRWCPFASEISDVLVPANTLLTMENLPFFAIYRTLTAPEMVKLAQSKYLDPAWDRELLKACIKWVDKESQTLMYNNWPEVWSPEKTAERVKGDGGMYYGDQVPTINVFDFYFWNDSGKVSGWNRRMILDAWSMPDLSTVGVDGKIPSPVRRKGQIYEKPFRGRFLYNPGNRKVSSREQILNWQFADLSAVAPFRYHSVRSLGFLMYAVCHLENRLLCRFNNAIFEQLMIYFRVNSDEDVQRALKVNLINKGFVDDALKFIPADERYQVNAQLAQLGLARMGQIVTENSGIYAQNQNYSRDQIEKTKFQVMTEVQATTQLVSSALQQAYMYQKPEYREIFRRFQIRDSRDPEVRRFQNECLKAGVSEKVLYNPSCWEIEPDRLMGAGNKTLELAISEQLMAWRHMYDPEPQRQILYESTLALTDDAAKSRLLVPENPLKISDSVHDAQLAAGTLMQGLPVAMKTGMNHIEYVETLLATLAQLIQSAGQQPPSPERLSGMANVLNHIEQHVQFLEQNPAEKPRVKQYRDALMKMGNALKGFAQQIAQQQEQAAAAGGGIDPETAAKIQAMQIQAQAKAETTKTAHAQRTAQRQVQFEREEIRKDQQTAAEIERENLKFAAKLKTDVVGAAAKVETDRAVAKAKSVDTQKKQD